MSLSGLIPLGRATLGAQPQSATTQASIEAGAAQIQNRGQQPVDVGVTGLELRRSTRRLIVSGNAAFAGTRDSLASLQFALGADIAPTPWEWWRTELVGHAITFGTLNHARGRARSGFIRQHVVRETFGGFATYGQGRGTVDRTPSHSSAFDVGGWVRHHALSSTLTFRRTRSTDWQMLEAAGYFLFRPASAYDLQDVTVTMQAQTHRFELFSSAGWRAGFSATKGTSNALLGGVTWNFAPHFALSVMAGRTFADPVRGLLESRSLSATVRWQSPRSLPVARSSTSRSSAISATVVRQSESGARLTVRVIAPATARVELSGSFSDWTPVAMTRENGAFVATILLPSGAHRVAVRIDGGAWRAPFGLPRAHDDLGGEVGLILVP